MSAPEPPLRAESLVLRPYRPDGSLGDPVTVLGGEAVVTVTWPDAPPDTVFAFGPLTTTWSVATGVLSDALLEVLLGPEGWAAWCADRDALAAWEGEGGALCPERKK